MFKSFKLKDFLDEEPLLCLSIYWILFGVCSIIFKSYISIQILHSNIVLEAGAFRMVYDITPFMDDHPGGDEVMLAATGKDATVDFEDVGHSDNARVLMDKYYIGEIDKATIPAKRSYSLSADKIYNSDNTPEFIKILQFLVPFMILGLAFTVRSYTRESAA